MRPAISGIAVVAAGFVLVRPSRFRRLSGGPNTDGVIG